MKNAIGGAPAPDFDHPIEMLEACHGRIEDRIDTLHRLLAHLAQHGCDEQARQAAVSVMRYFDTAGEHHHEDEEVDLFPLIAERCSEPEATALMVRLRSDHVKMRALWQVLRVPLAAIAAGASAHLDEARVEEFGRFYREHIALEEDELFPLAEGLLDEKVVAKLGARMAHRRGVKTT